MVSRITARGAMPSYPSAWRTSPLSNTALRFLKRLLATARSGKEGGAVEYQSLKHATNDRFKGLVVADNVLDKLGDNGMFQLGSRRLRANHWALQKQRDLLILEKLQEQFLAGFDRVQVDTTPLRMFPQGLRETALAVFDLLFLSGYVRVREWPRSAEPVGGLTRAICGRRVSRDLEGCPPCALA